MKAKLFFADAKVKKAFEKLASSLKSEGEKIRGCLTKAFREIQQDAFCGIQIPKRLIPKDTEPDSSFHKNFYISPGYVSCSCPSN